MHSDITLINSLRRMIMIELGLVPALLQAGDDVTASLKELDLRDRRECTRKFRKLARTLYKDKKSFDPCHISRRAKTLLSSLIDQVIQEKYGSIIGSAIVGDTMHSFFEGNKTHYLNNCRIREANDLGIHTVLERIRKAADRCAITHDSEV